MAMRLLPALLALLAAAPAVARAEIAVFTDGRILKVEDAYLAGGQIVLELPGDGRMVVPAVRIDRVVGDEVEEPPAPELRLDCGAGWADDPLPEWVPYRQAIADAARASGLHPWLLAVLVEAESDFEPRALSRAGAAGLTQLMPAAALDEGVADVFDPVQNLRGGAAHLRALLDRFGSLALALAAYNAGGATVERYEGIPPFRETRAYVRRILAAFCPRPVPVSSTTSKALAQRPSS